jgi:hypothetical protein
MFIDVPPPVLYTVGMMRNLLLMLVAVPALAGSPAPGRPPPFLFSSNALSVRSAGAAYTVLLRDGRSLRYAPQRDGSYTVLDQGRVRAFHPTPAGGWSTLTGTRTEIWSPSGPHTVSGPTRVSYEKTGISADGRRFSPVPEGWSRPR